jgi:ribosomal protein S20
MRSDMPVEEKEKLMHDIYSQLDKAAKKGVIHHRTASRRKARIAAYVNSLSE